MQSSKLSFQYWFMAVHLITSIKENISIKEMQRQLKYKRYEPIWTMMHKIRSVMELRDDAEYNLSNPMKLEEVFLGAINRDFVGGVALKSEEVKNKLLF